MPPPEQVMFLPAVFWMGSDDPHPQEAMITVEEEVVYISCRSGVQVRLMPQELDALVLFVAEELLRQEQKLDDEADDIELTIRICGCHE